MRQRSSSRIGRVLVAVWAISTALVPAAAAVMAVSGLQLTGVL